MINRNPHIFLTALDDYLRDFVGRSADAVLQTMLQYALGWVDAEGNPYDRPTGKRVRPQVVLLCAQAVDRNWQRAIPAAAAVELTHNFSLIHDDIQDNSLLRHGRDTVWVVWGVANAINAGDAMFTLAYKALGELVAQDVDRSQVLQAYTLFSETNLELTRGQHLDMAFERRSAVSTDDYLSMIRGKSAALLASSAQLGALANGADAARQAHFYEFGLNIGIAFQIHDDLLSVWGEESVMGKSGAIDIVAKKKSLPILYGLERDQSLRTLYQQETLTEEDVDSVVERLNAHNAHDYTRDVERAYYERALAALDRATVNSTSESIDALHSLVDMLFKRAY